MCVVWRFCGKGGDGVRGEIDVYLGGIQIGNVDGKVRLFFR